MDALVENNNGRPKKVLDPEQVRKLAALHCSVDEIADILKCGRDTIYRHHKAELDQGRAEGRMRLRTMQFSSAKSGSAAMLIWLGKQILNQKDSSELSLTTNDEDVLSEEELEEMISKIDPDKQKIAKNERAKAPTKSD